MSAPVQVLTVGDRAPAFAQQVLDDDGNVVDLTGATLLFRMAIADGVSLPISGAAAPVGDPTLGNFAYAWGADDTLIAGVYEAELHVTKAGLTATYPPRAPWIVEIREEV